MKYLLKNNTTYSDYINIIHKLTEAQSSTVSSNLLQNSAKKEPSNRMVDSTIIPSHYMNHPQSHLDHRISQCMNKYSQKVLQNNKLSLQNVELKQKIQRLQIHCQQLKNDLQTSLDLLQKIIQHEKSEQSKQNSSQFTKTTYFQYQKTQMLIKQVQNLKEKVKKSNYDHIQLLPQRLEQKKSETLQSTSNTANHSLPSDDKNDQNLLLTDHQQQPKGNQQQDSSVQELQQENDSNPSSEECAWAALYSPSLLVGKVAVQRFFQRNFFKSSYYQIIINRFQKPISKKCLSQKSQLESLSLSTQTTRQKLHKLKYLRTQARKKYHSRFYEQSTLLYNEALMQVQRIRSDKYFPLIKHEISDLKFALENECGVVEYYRRNFQESKRHFKQCLDEKKNDMNRSGQAVQDWPIFQIMMRNFVLCLQQLAPQAQIVSVWNQLGTLYHHRKCFEQSDECFELTLKTAQAVMKQERKQLEDWVLYRFAMKQWSEVKQALGEIETAKKIFRLINDQRINENPERFISD